MIVSRFIHYKGGEYEGISSVAKFERDGDVGYFYVVYRGTDGQVWIREQMEFQSKVMVEGRMVNRFHPMFDDVPDEAWVDPLAEPLYNARLESDGLKGPLYTVVRMPDGSVRIREQSKMHGTLHVYGQSYHHDDVHIVGDRQALAQIRDAINQVLGTGEPAATPSVFPKDGEGYAVRVRLYDHDFSGQEWQVLAAPYEGDYAQESDKRALYPVGEDGWAQLVKGRQEFTTKMDDFHGMVNYLYELKQRFAKIIGDDSVIVPDTILDTAADMLEISDRFMIEAKDDVCYYVTVDKCRQEDGSVLWAVRRYSGSVLGRINGLLYWIYEPQPSNRDEEFIRNFRFKTYAEAVAAYQEFLEVVKEK